MITPKPTNYESRQCFAHNPQFDYQAMYGVVDDLKVFARVLNSTEISALAKSKNETIS